MNFFSTLSFSNGLADISLVDSSPEFNPPAYKTFPVIKRGVWFSRKIILDLTNGVLHINGVVPQTKSGTKPHLSINLGVS